jgi:hypothetical protein
MKKLVVLFFTTFVFCASCSFLENNSANSKIYLDPNRITIKCEKCQVGDKGKVDGIEYEVVDNDLLRARIKQKVDITKLCTSLVTDMSTDNDEGLFGRDFNQRLEHWDVSNVVNMKWMFINSSFNQPIGNWDVGKVKNMQGIFKNTSFNQPIGNWDVGNVVDMSWMFNNTSFNQSLTNWNVSKVLNMEFMFYESKFNQNISKWCVSTIKSEPNFFSSNAPLTSANKPAWGTCSK